MGKKNFIAVDGSEQAQNAFWWYIENLHRQGDSVLIAHCAEYNINIFPGTQDVKTINEICESIKERNDEINNLTDTFMNELRPRKIEAKVLHLNGSKPGESLVEAAVKEKADHIIMGTRGLGKLKRAFLGSVSEYVIHHSDCPVTIIRKQE